ncbi:MAG: ABC transporter permease [Tetrasphaera sp.]
MTTTTTRPPAAAATPTPPERRGGGRLGRWRNSWRVSLTMARRDARRYRGRSALIVVMVALPVALIVGGLTFGATSNISSREQLPSRLGNAAAVIDSISEDVVVQGADGSYGFGGSGEKPKKATTIPGYDRNAPAAEQAAAISRLVGGPVAVIQTGDFRWTAGERRPYGSVVFLDPKVDYGAKARLTSGRWPTSNAEVAVTPLGEREGLPSSGTIELKLGDEKEVVTVVGVVDARDSNIGMPHLVTTAPWVADRVWQTTFLIMRPTPVLWPEVRKLNGYGLAVTSRAVVENPPSPAELPAEAQTPQGEDVAAMRLAAAMLGALLFVITALLVGPAFAVSAGRQRRSLALAASNGAETRQLRRSVLASAVVLGALAVVIGAAAGIAVAAAGAGYWRSSRPWTTLFGPTDIPWIAVIIVAACAILAALTAALIPALRLGRLDIVGVMKGQNVSPPHSRKLPVVGLVLFLIGSAGAFYAVTANSPVGAVVAILGLFIGPLLCIPILLVWAGRLAARFPAAVRMATRDASRQRHRSVPTVAAVMAGAALLATFAVAYASSTKFEARQYQPRTIAGEGTTYVGDKESRAELEGIIAANAPTWKLVPEYAVSIDYANTSDTAPTTGPFLSVLAKGCTPADTMPGYSGQADPYADRTCLKAGSVGGPARSGLLVLPAAEIVRRLQLTGADAQAVRDGAILVADRAWISGGTVRIAYGEVKEPDTQQPTIATSKTVDLPALPIPASQYARGGVETYTGLLIPQEVTNRLGVQTVNAAMHIYDPNGPISRDSEKKVVERLSADGGIEIERGYQSQSFRIMLIVFAITAFLLVTVTLISTALALAEQQSDMGTLAAVGATKGTRRRFAAAQAATVGLLGVGLGIVIGLVAGVAISYPSTSSGWDEVTQQQITLSPTIGIPVIWLASILIGVPLIAAVIAGLSIRKAPTVTRRD